MSQLGSNSIEGPQGGTPPPPKIGKAFEEGKRRKGMSPRQETVPHLSNGVAECGKHNQRKAGGLEAPRSSLETSKLRLETPKSRPGGSKIEAWGLQNRDQSSPRRPFQKTFILGVLLEGRPSLSERFRTQTSSKNEAQEAPKSRPGGEKIDAEKQHVFGIHF